MALISFFLPMAHVVVVKHHPEEVNQGFRSLPDGSERTTTLGSTRLNYTVEQA